MDIQRTACRQIKQQDLNLISLPYSGEVMLGGGQGVASHPLVNVDNISPEIAIILPAILSGQLDLAMTEHCIPPQVIHRSLLQYNHL